MEEVKNYSFKSMSLFNLLFFSCFYLPFSFGLGVLYLQFKAESLNTIRILFGVALWCGIVVSNVMLFLDYYLMKKLKGSSFIINYSSKHLVIPCRRLFFPEFKLKVVNFDEVSEIRKSYMSNSLIGLNIIIGLNIKYVGGEVEIARNNFESYSLFENFIKDLESDSTIKRKFID